MSDFYNIEKNLNNFIKKYFLHELLRNTIFFFLFSFLYVLLTAIIEYFFWLPRTGRKYLFFVQFVVIGFFFIFFIIKPLLNYLGFLRHLSYEEASQIIGNHFPDIKDKLLNTIQLKQSTQKSALLLASIQQKSKELSVFRFSKAVNFKQIYKYIPFLFLPFIILIFLRITNYDTPLTKGYQRVLSYEQEFMPPLPYSFQFLDTLSVLQSNEFQLNIALMGSELPHQLFIEFNEQKFPLTKINDTLFSFYFPILNEPLSFSLTDSKHFLGTYRINVIYPPIIQHTQIILNYPSYLHKKTDTISYLGNLTVPQSTNIKWIFKTQHTDSILFSINNKKNIFPIINNYFTFKKQATADFNYHVQPFNKNTQTETETNYQIRVIQDEFPQILVKEYKDNINLQNYYNISATDDYLITKLQLVYTQNQTNETKAIKISVPSSDFIKTNFIFPGNLKLEEGASYSYYFQVFDNDAINGYKSTRSKEFYYNQLTTLQQQEYQLKQEQNQISAFNTLQHKFSQQNEQLNAINSKILSQKEIDWKTQKLLQQTLQQLETQDEFFKNTLSKFKNLLNQPKDSINTLKEDLQKRIDELQKLNKNKKILDELKQLAEKLKKEDLIQKLSDLKNFSEHREKSLKRILLLTKKYFITQKLNHLSKRLDTLSTEQKKLSQTNSDKVKDQDSINRQMNKLSKQLDSIHKMNNTLNKPMNIPDTKTLSDEIKMDMQKATQQLKDNSPTSANTTQQKAANKIKSLSKSIQMAAQQGGGEQNKEDIKTLQSLLKSLLYFSFKQESLLTESYQIKQSTNLSQHLLSQNHLKKYFLHIDDSLYTLALRNPKISQKILDESYQIKIDLDKTLAQLSQNKLFNAQNYAQYVLKGANTLADFLSNTLNQMKSASAALAGKPGNGKSKGFSLPDIIKKQEQSIGQLQQSLSQKGQNSNQKGRKEGLSKQQYELYKQQQQIKDELQQLTDRFTDKSLLKQINQLTQQMSHLQKRLLEEGVTQNTLNKMIKVHHELLQLKNATFTQKQENKRVAETNYQSYKGIDSLYLQKIFNNQPIFEYLQRMELPVNQQIKNKILYYLR